MAGDIKKRNQEYIANKMHEIALERMNEKIENNTKQVSVLNETQLIMMEAMADQYEQQLEQELISMESQATIYETLLELKGEA